MSRRVDGGELIIEEGARAEIIFPGGRRISAGPGHHAERGPASL
ncbi:hypothetical protein AB0F81_41195 [Actinoplanes sp. NPDC024001]